MESIIVQTFTDYEQIIIDGGSIDGSLDVIIKYANEHTYWISEPDNGIYNAMNKGINKAIGEYCFFLNSGDFFIDKYVLENFCIRKPSAEIIFGNLSVSLNGKVISRVLGKPKLTFFDLYNSNVVKHQSTFIQRQVFDRFGLFNEDQKIVSDWEFFIKTLGFGSVSYQYLDLDIADFDNNGLSNNAKKLVEKEKENVLNKYINPMMLNDYRYFNDLHFMQPALKYKISKIALRIISKCAKIYDRNIKR